MFSLLRISNLPAQCCQHLMPAGDVCVLISLKLTLVPALPFHSAVLAMTLAWGFPLIPAGSESTTVFTLILHGVIQHATPRCCW